MPAEPVLSTEVVFFHLYDVGRSIDLRKAAELIPALDNFDIVKRRDTPASLSLPRALTLSLGDNEVAERGEFESFSAHASPWTPLPKI